MLNPKTYCDLSILKTYSEIISNRLENIMLDDDADKNLLEDELLMDMTYVDSIRITMEEMLNEIKEIDNDSSM